MNWEKLLSSVRIRELCGGEVSLRSPGDPRTEFERDYGRTIFSTPVRRLQDKAQVFPLVEHDAVRTRLTHSIEVSSVARGLGAMAEKWLDKEGELPTGSLGAIEFIAVTCGMIHDLGNPPFGHAGEDAIRQWCMENGNLDAAFKSCPQCKNDFELWNGNAQTIRLVGRLQVLADMYGLNLTCATFSAACKYIASSDTIDPNRHDWSKAGYFFSERQLIQDVREATGTGPARHPITFLVEASDDIVYSCVDLEDGIKKRLITWDRLEEELLQRSGRNEHTEQALKLAKKMIANNVQASARDDAMAQAFRTRAINEMVLSVLEEFKKSYRDIIGGNYHDELVRKCSAAPLIGACKDIAREVVYRCDEVLRVEVMGRALIGELLTIFWEAAEHYPSWGAAPFGEKAFLLMSSNYRQVFQDALRKIKTGDKEFTEAPEVYYRVQLVCDYVAGMTDTFATNLHKRLTNG